MTHYTYPHDDGDLTIDEVAAYIIHNPEFEDHREHIVPLATRILELLGDKSPVLAVMVAPDSMPTDDGGPTYKWLRGGWHRGTVMYGHVWVQGVGVFPTPTPAQLMRSTELWPEGHGVVEGWSQLK